MNLRSVFNANGAVWAKRISRFKAIEVETYWSGICFAIELYLRLFFDSGRVGINLFYLLGFKVEFSRNCSHAGFQVAVILFGIECWLYFYDIRHWDNENCRPMEIGEPID